jgi:hypothetical protein
MKYLLTIGCLFLIQSVFTQPPSNEKTPFNYLGVIKLNDTAFISYKLAFEVKDNVIEGYSITDAGGPHETKSNIKGSYNTDDKELVFNEYDIVYTKSPITELDFCLVNFKGKMRNLEKNKPFSGDFSGLYPDGKACLDGQIIMSPLAQVEKRAKKADKMIQKSKRFAKKIKDNISATTALDTLSMSVVKTGENLNVFTKTKNVIVAIYDAGKVDDDRINLYIDGKLILSNYAIEKNRKEIPITITKEFTVIKVEALNEGTSAPNTVKVEINDGQRLISTRTSLKSNEHAALTLVNQ